MSCPEAPPRSGGAGNTVRYQAEPGNEGDKKPAASAVRLSLIEPQTILKDNRVSRVHA